MRDDNNVLRNENDLLLNTVEVLTHELSESRAMVKSNESMDDVVVTYANSLPVAGAALPDSIEINHVQATGEQDQLSESCTSLIFEMQNTQACVDDQSNEYVQGNLQPTQLQIAQPSFDDQIKEYIQKHKRTSNGQHEEKLVKRKKSIQNHFKRKEAHQSWLRNHEGRKQGPKTRDRKRDKQQYHTDWKRGYYDIFPRPGYNFHVTTLKKRPPDWIKYLKLVRQITSSTFVNNHT